MSDAGIDADTQAQLIRAFSDSERVAPVTEEAMRSMPESGQQLWLGKVDDSWLTVVMFDKVISAAPIVALANRHADVTYVDTISTLSSALEALRARGLMLLAIAYGCIAILIAAKHSAADALRMISVPATSSTIALLLLHATGAELGLFHLFGLFIVLGLGMDYAIIMRSSHTANNDSHVRAISLAALTSILSFGLLSFTSTPMIASFGATVLIGTIFNVFFAAAFLRQSTLDATC